jgi:valyl-tRNA synthetase
LPGEIESALLQINVIAHGYMASFQKLGASFAFKTPYHTLDDRSIKIAQETFLRLLTKGLIRYEDRPSLWCYKCETNLAESEREAIDHDTPSKVFYLRTNTLDGVSFSFATTQPELLGGTVAFVAHPSHPLVGKEAYVPGFERQVRIYGHPSISPEFGTGIMMLSTFGNWDDVRLFDYLNARGENLEIVGLTDERGILQPAAGMGLQGLLVNEYATRRRAMEYLQAQGILEQVVKHIIPDTYGHDRCKQPLGIRSSPQLVFDYRQYIQQAIDILNKGKISVFPEEAGARLIQHILNKTGIWELSRQLDWGIPIPAGYIVTHDGNMKIVPVRSRDLPIRNLAELADYDFRDDRVIPLDVVFDTWWTSASSPNIPAGRDANTGYATYMRFQSKDILYNWAAYTLIKHLALGKTLPWEVLQVTSLFLTEGQGGRKKLSKSVGAEQTLDKLIEKYGADPLRMFLLDVDPKTDLVMPAEKDQFNARMDAGIQDNRKLLNKLWNLSNLYLTEREKFGDYPSFSRRTIQSVDRWILSVLNDVVERVTDAYQKGETGIALRTIKDFIYRDFADTYIELTKPRVYSGNQRTRETSLSVIEHVLYATYRLLAPIAPFITEKLYQEVIFREGMAESIRTPHNDIWPEYVRTRRLGKTYRTQPKDRRIGSLTTSEKIEYEEERHTLYGRQRALFENVVRPWFTEANRARDYAIREHQLIDGKLPTLRLSVDQEVYAANRKELDKYLHLIQTSKKIEQLDLVYW